MDNKIKKDLDLIVKNEKVKNIMFDKNKFVFETEPLIIYASEGTLHYGGKYRVEINLLNSDIKFFGSDNQGRKSYWTDKDPHPHVNGFDGSACLGNVGTTLAELCSQTQLYPLVLMCIDFLESANQEDSAGKNVLRWDVCDENGNIIEEGASEEENIDECYESLQICSDCDSEVSEDDYSLIVAWGRMTVAGRVEDERRICESCAESYIDAIDRDGSDVLVGDIHEEEGDDF